MRIDEKSILALFALAALLEPLGCGPAAPREANLPDSAFPVVTTGLTRLC